MYDATFWSKIITSLIWPVFVFFILLLIFLLFRKQIYELFKRTKSFKTPWAEFEFFQDGDVFTPKPTVVTPAPPKLELPKLSADHEEDSKKRAQARLDEDTKRNGFQRGELFQSPNEQWAINWRIKI